MNDGDDETAPLVQSTHIQSGPAQMEYSMDEEQPPPYSSYDEKSGNPPPYYVHPTTPTPSEDGAGGSLIPHINCRVCQTVLSVEGKMYLHVIKCHSCGEATPIRPAPVGKKYVRCPCNCLLICKSTSQRIICPRPNCKRVISLGPNVSSASFDAPSPMRRRNPTRRIICAFCNTSFVWVQPGDVYERCPHCDRSSSFGPGYRRKRIKSSIIIGLIFLVIAVGVTVGVIHCTEDCHWTKLSYVAFCILYGIAALLFARAMVYYCVKVSTVERPQLQYT